MTTQDTGLQLVSGAFVSHPADGSTPETIPFKYDPATLQRALRPEMVGGTTGDRCASVQFTAARIEDITLEICVHVSDEPDKELAAMSGVAPLLAAIENLSYPSTGAVEQVQSTLAQGTLEVVPPVTPPVDFIFGINRVLPVRIVSIQINDETFDINLNTIRARVSVRLRILDHSAVSPTRQEYADFLH